MSVVWYDLGVLYTRMGEESRNERNVRGVACRRAWFVIIRIRNARFEYDERFCYLEL